MRVVPTWILVTLYIVIHDHLLFRHKLFAHQSLFLADSARTCIYQLQHEFVPFADEAGGEHVDLWFLFITYQFIVERLLLGGSLLIITRYNFIAAQFDILYGVVHGHILHNFIQSRALLPSDHVVFRLLWIS